MTTPTAVSALKAIMRLCDETFDPGQPVGEMSERLDVIYETAREALHYERAATRRRVYALRERQKARVR